MRNVWEMLVVIGVAFLVVLVILSVFGSRTRHGNPRMACRSNLSQIVKACTTYQEPNGDYFPAFWDGERFDPMKSLAMLYPDYVDNVKDFGCPSTKDRSEITVTVVTERDKRCAFGPVDTEQEVQLLLR